MNIKYINDTLKKVIKIEYNQTPDKVMLVKNSEYIRINNVAYKRLMTLYDADTDTLIISVKNWETLFDYSYDLKNDNIQEDNSDIIPDKIVYISNDTFNLKFSCSAKALKPILEHIKNGNIKQAHLMLMDDFSLGLIGAANAIKFFQINLEWAIKQIQK